ncbi:MAG: FtsH protease activity modulator HflK [Alphaproteobacteria bacterium]|nr:FtsH protease activity modulator HflK [Alphaproteobacteria bacterium]MBL6936756.1 FtsH protease activity modulator HflK [Alphaproteobacteria bacterium]MBL7097525.1 FtsH protease activity modulator HflK [Alphaproteobacteria bacterium]
MPWTNSSGGSGSGNNGGPWNRPGSGGSGGGNRPPDIEEMLRRSQDRLRGFLPGRGLGSTGLIIILLIVVGVWLLSGIYFVGASEQGIVLRFGAYMKRTAPGLNYHLPWPIETAYTINVTGQRQITIGYRTADSDDAQAGQDIPAEADMLTGDENIIDINFTVQWVVKDAGAYQFNVEDPEGTVKAVAESAMREVVGRSQFEAILTQDREHIQMEVRDLMQKTLDDYGAGITVTNVIMQKADPPGDVLAAYRDVQAARADQERARNEAEGYANKVIPNARGSAARIVQDAEAYRQQVIAEASGQAKRFLSILAQYRAAPDVTRRRIYLETMAGILKDMNKVVVDDSAKGVVPYFQLPNMLNGSTGGRQQNGQSGAQQ